MSLVSATAVNIPELYKEQNLFPSINRKRPSRPLEMLNFRRGVGDLVCLREVTGGPGGPYTPLAQSASDVCDPILQRNPNSRMGEYLDCVNNVMTEGINACGFSYKKWPQVDQFTKNQCLSNEKLSQSPAERTCELLNNVVYRKNYHYPSKEAFEASKSHWTQIGDEGFHSWDSSYLF
jgi:hypothetical protein